MQHQRHFGTYTKLQTDMLQHLALDCALCMSLCCAHARGFSSLTNTRSQCSLFLSLFLCLALSFSRFLASLALSRVCAPSLSLSNSHAHTGRTRQEISFHLRAQSGPGCHGGDLRSAQSIQRQAPPAILGWPTEAQAPGEYAVSVPTFKN